ncbi:hypothetical protein BJX99DRAFT_157983 [Aspergillus californicus]
MNGRSSGRSGLRVKGRLRVGHCSQGSQGSQDDWQLRKSRKISQATRVERLDRPCSFIILSVTSSQLLSCKESDLKLPKVA